MSTFTAEETAWDSGPAILARVALLRQSDRVIDLRQPAPLGGYSFRDLPWRIRYKIYALIFPSDASGSEPIIQPWPRTKFPTKLLYALGKDIHAEVAYFFYGKGNEGYDQFAHPNPDADHMVLDKVEDDGQQPIVDNIHNNTFLGMENFMTAQLVRPAKMYRFLIRNLFLSHGTRFGQATLNYINSFPNLEKVGFGSVALLQSEDILDDPNFDYLARSHMRRNRQLVKTIRAVLATFGELEDRSVWVWIKQDFVLSASLPDHRDERDMVDQMHWETDSRPRLTPRLAPHLPDKLCGTQYWRPVLSGAYFHDEFDSGGADDEWQPVGQDYDLHFHFQWDEYN